MVATAQRARAAALGRLAAAIASTFVLSSACVDSGTPALGAPDVPPADASADASDAPHASGACEDAVDPCACFGFEGCDAHGAILCLGDEVQVCRLHAATGCTYLGPPLACDDGLPCTGLERCVAGVGCVSGQPPAGCCGGLGDCDDGDLCNGLGVCDLATGTCALGASPSCDDGDPCNGHETCSPLLGCLSGAPPACDDGDACNGAELCDPEVGCLPGTPPSCDDGLPCTGLETCDPAEGCVAGEPPAGCCADASDCEDGNPCNGLGSCDVHLGTCSVTAPPTCVDADPCNGEEVCDPATGECVASAPPVCEDGNVCNGVATCVPGVGCVPGAPLVCVTDLCEGVLACEQHLAQQRHATYVLLRHRGSPSSVVRSSAFDLRGPGGLVDQLTHSGRRAPYTTCGDLSQPSSR